MNILKGLVEQKETGKEPATSIASDKVVAEGTASTAARTSEVLSKKPVVEVLDEATCRIQVTCPTSGFIRYYSGISNDYIPSGVAVAEVKAGVPVILNVPQHPGKTSDDQLTGWVFFYTSKPTPTTEAVEQTSFVLQGADSDPAKEDPRY